MGSCQTRSRLIKIANTLSSSALLLPRILCIIINVRILLAVWTYAGILDEYSDTLGVRYVYLQKKERKTFSPHCLKWD